MSTRRLSVVMALLTAGVALLAAQQSSGATSGRIRVLTDVAMFRATDWRGRRVELGVDLYLPTSGGRRPALVWLHGGGFFTGSRREAEPIGYGLATRGYAVASIGYRLRTEAALARTGYQGALADAEVDTTRAVRWLRAHAEELSIDPARIAIGGHSAGAFTALATADTDDGESRLPVRPCLAVSIAGGLDAARVGRAPSPTILFHSPSDPVVPIAYAGGVWEAVHARHVNVWWVELPGQGHTPDQLAYQTRIVPRLAAAMKQAC